MKIRKTVISAMALLLALCMALTGCGSAQSGAAEGGAASAPSASAEPEEALKTVVLSESWAFPTMYPVISPETSSNYGIAYWTRNFYDTLVIYDENNEIVGSLAESWDISEDGTVYTFRLRDGVLFSDGTPLTADAVKQSIDAARINLGSYLGNYGKIGALITNTEAPDDSTFVLTLSSPYYAALNDLSFCMPYAIVNPKAFANGAEKASELCASETMGTGPYMLDGYDGSAYTFVRNPNYWGEAPDVDCFKVKEISDNDAKILALKSHEISALIGANQLTYDGFTELSAAGFGTSITPESTRSRYLGLRIADTNIYNEDYTEVVQTVPAGVFADKSVRLAASYAIDQQLLSEKVFNGIDGAAETLFPKSKPYCALDLTTYATDAAEAGRILDEAGWLDADGDGVREKDGQTLTVTLSFSNDFGTLASAMSAIKAQLEAVGFSVTLAPAANMMDWYMAAMTGNYDLIFWESNGGEMDPSSTTSNIGSMADPVLGKLPGFGSISYELIAELDTTPSTERVQEIYKIILGSIADEALVIPVSYKNEVCVWDSDVIAGYDYYYDAKYTLVQNIRLK